MREIVKSLYEIPELIVKIHNDINLFTIRMERLDKINNCI